MYKMIVFDCDGTLLDSSAMIAMIQKGYSSMFPQRKKQPYAFFIPCYYMSDEENLAYLQIPKSCKRQFEELCFGKCGDFSSHTHIFEGIQELLRQLLDDGIALGIATSRNTTAFLELQSMFDADIFSAFSSIGTQDVVKHTKPAPDVLYYIMEQTNLTAQELLFIGDSINDALCAKAAGVDFAWAKWGVVSEEELPYTYCLYDHQDVYNILR